MIRLNWTGGEHDFALRLGELRALQKACDAGPEEILTRLLRGTWRVDDVVETLRLGLIGAGMAREEAARLVNLQCDQGLPAALRLTASAILGHALLPPEDRAEAADGDAGKPEGAPLPPESGASAASTATAP